MEAPNRVPLASWSEALFKPARYKVAYGGRGSGKTWSVAFALVAQASTRLMRVMVTRDVQKSIDLSSKITIEIAIRRLGLTHAYRIGNEVITCKLTGSTFRFHGLGKTQEDDIKGWESLDVVWVEEAHTMSRRAWELLRPTIRKPGSEIWITFNPTNRTDVVWQEFCTGRDFGDLSVQIHKINYHDNPGFTPELEAERKLCLLTEPDRYEHIWMGVPDDGGATRQVLPYHILNSCVEAYNRHAPSTERYRSEIGLDIADSGIDRNALVERRGPIIVAWRSWTAPVIGDTARLADAYARRRNAFRLHYDSGGIGGGVRSYFSEMPQRPYATRPINFGGAVTGPERRYSYRITNQEQFLRRNSQLGFALRLRGMNTQKLLAGESVSPEKCLFINPDGGKLWPDETGRPPSLDAFLSQLSQPRWDDSQTGKVMLIKKQPDEPSPDLYDASVLAYAYDSENGLRYN